MKALPVADYLVEFLPNEDARDGAIGRDVGRLNLQSPAKVEEAYARGFESGKAAAEATFDVRLEAQKARLTQQFAFERQASAENEAGRLADTLSSGLQELRLRIAETAARVLEPFVTDELRRKAIEELQESLEALVTRDAAVTLKISGPNDFLDALRPKLDGRSLAVSYHSADDCDVRITAGQTIIETRLGAWMAKLREALK